LRILSQLISLILEENKFVRT